MKNRSSSGFRKRLLVFFALAFAWSWVCWLLSSVVKVQFPSLAGALFLASGFGSSIGVAVVKQVGGRDGLR